MNLMQISKSLAELVPTAYEELDRTISTLDPTRLAPGLLERSIDINRNAFTRTIQGLSAMLGNSGPMVREKIGTLDLITGWENLVMIITILVVPRPDRAVSDAHAACEGMDDMDMTVAMACLIRISTTLAEEEDSLDLNAAIACLRSLFTALAEDLDKLGTAAAKTCLSKISTTLHGFRLDSDHAKTLADEVAWWREILKHPIVYAFPVLQPTFRDAERLFAEIHRMAETPATSLPESVSAGDRWAKSIDEYMPRLEWHESSIVATIELLKLPGSPFAAQGLFRAGDNVDSIQAALDSLEGVKYSSPWWKRKAQPQIENMFGKVGRSYIPQPISDRVR
ncbi:hypothetical protein LTR22_026664 [Elasticomyces elasticus]|nr:hypothetical protein LTR22_026664 [Elasticomyces elasticus]